jgi:hypothetical protein
VPGCRGDAPDLPGLGAAYEPPPPPMASPAAATTPPPPPPSSAASSLRRRADGVFRPEVRVTGRAANHEHPDSLHGLGHELLAALDAGRADGLAEAQLLERLADRHELGMLRKQRRWNLVSRFHVFNSSYPDAWFERVPRKPVADPVDDDVLGRVVAASGVQ